MVTLEPASLAVPDFAFPFTPPGGDLSYPFGSDGEDDAETGMFTAIEEHSELLPPHETVMTDQVQKKRRRTGQNQTAKDQELRQGSPASSDGTSEQDKGKPGSLRLTDAIDKLAAEQEVLKFDSVSQLYIVLDGPGFEQRFDELRCTRAKRSDGSNSRPFSRMHNHYVLVRGEKWAKTGSAFRAKDAVHELPRGDQTQASKINITLLPSDEAEGFQVTLQHFLNVTGAGDLFKNARQQQEQRALMQQQQQQQQQHHAQHMNGNGHMGFSNGFAPQVAMQPMYPTQQFASHQHYTGSVTGAMHSMWTHNSKGDQAYFFFRDEGVGKFRNGSVVMLQEGKILPDAAPDEGCIFMVVSDDNAKWKGEPLPSPEEEELGHWCCFLGQVPVWVEGGVKSGEYIGPKCDGSGHACVRQLGDGWPVLGLALASKDTTELGVVRTLAFAGLNAMSCAVGDKITPLFEQAVQMREDVAELRQDLERTKVVTDANTMNLTDRLNKMEVKLMSNRLTKEDEEYLERKREEAVAHQLFMRNLALVMMILAVTMAVVFFLVGWFGFWGTGGEERVVVYNQTQQSTLSCQDMGSYAACVARQGGRCEWVNFGDAGSFCLDPAIFAMAEDDLPRCPQLSHSACMDHDTTHEMCKWEDDTCLENVVTHQYHCKKKAERTACSDYQGCEWVEGADREGCVVAGSLTGLCSSVPTQQQCDRTHACSWKEEEGGVCGIAGYPNFGAEDASCSIYEIEADCAASQECEWDAQGLRCETMSDVSIPGNPGTGDETGELPDGGGGQSDDDDVDPPVEATPLASGEEIINTSEEERGLVAVVVPAVFGLLALLSLPFIALLYMKRKKIRDEVAEELEAVEKGEMEDVEMKAKALNGTSAAVNGGDAAVNGGVTAPEGPTGV